MPPARTFRIAPFLVLLAAATVFAGIRPTPAPSPQKTESPAPRRYRIGETRPQERTFSERPSPWAILATIGLAVFIPGGSFRFSNGGTSVNIDTSSQK